MESNHDSYHDAHTTMNLLLFIPILRIEKENDVLTKLLESLKSEHTIKDWKGDYFLSHEFISRKFSDKPEFADKIKKLKNDPQFD